MKKFIVIVGIAAIAIIGLLCGLAYFVQNKAERESKQKQTEPARRAQEKMRIERSKEELNIKQDEEKTIV